MIPSRCLGSLLSLLLWVLCCVLPGAHGLQSQYHSLKSNWWCKEAEYLEMCLSQKGRINAPIKWTSERPSTPSSMCGHTRRHHLCIRKQPGARHKSCWCLWLSLHDLKMAKSVPFIHKSHTLWGALFQHSRAFHLEKWVMELSRLGGTGKVGALT